MKYFIVDAFTDKVFGGNQAGVCLLDDWPTDDLMQNIAAENCLAETAFAVKRDDYYELRWFTPKIEVKLCGHATLATAFVILEIVDKNISSIDFHTKSGVLEVEKHGDLLIMDFPSRTTVPIEVTVEMTQALGMPVLEAHKSATLLLLLENEMQIKELQPNFDLISKLDEHAIMVTAKGDEVDFVSRNFGPNVGIPEDSVTGSAHTTLIPFWAERLGKSKMTARQLSKRGGVLYCENCGERVKIAGKAKLYLKGEILIGIENI